MKKQLTIISVYILFTACLSFSAPLFHRSKLVSQLQPSISSMIIKMQKPGDIVVFPINSHWILISFVPEWSNKKNNFIDQPISPNIANNINNYHIMDINSKGKISIAKAGFKRRVLYAPIPSRRNDLRISEKVYIKLNKPLAKQHKYTLYIDKNLTGKKIEKQFIYNPDFTVSLMLHIDPYGYRPKDRKKFYLGLNMGSAGEIKPDTFFSVLRLSDNKTVYKGEAEKQKYTGWPSYLKNKPYSQVYLADFSKVKTPGKYIIRHSSGYSLPFRITEDIHRVTLNSLALGMYHQRRGENILKKYTYFTRPATVENQTFIYNSKNLDKFLIKLFRKLPDNKKKILYRTSIENSKVKFNSAGHMDAGDYSPYTYNSSLLVYNLISTLDLFKENVFHDNLGLPESGDGIPDILQEAMLELNWLKEMQDPIDGGVFSMSKPFGMPYQNKMTGKDANIKRYLAPKDTTVTGAYAATLARAARSPVIKQYYPELITELKNKAVKAWKWLESNPGFHGYHHYGTENKDLDERAWAAIELYALTGVQHYHDSFKNLHRPLKRANGVEWMNHSYGNVNRTLAMWDANNVTYKIENNLKETSQNRFHDYLLFCVKNAENMPYNLCFNDVYKRFYMIGWFFPVSFYSWDLLIGYKLYGKQKFLETALDQIHYTLGSNPMNKTFITGMGYNRFHEIVDQKSIYDNIEQPVSGLPVSPVTTEYTYLHKYNINFNKLTYPASKFDTKIKEWDKKKWNVYGILELPYDGWNIKGEMTIEKLGSMLSCMAILTPLKNKKTKRPEFSIQILKQENNVVKIKVNFIHKINDNFYMLWFINGFPVSSNPDFTQNMKDINKPFNLGLEITTVRGMKFYNEINIEQY
ncbi:MAG: hypothetical protein GY756_03460 [bacterium]|nr:hypothetical protein [bacterium]